MLKKLEQLGYIKYIPYKGAILTDKGLTVSQKITRKHRILERFLKDILKIKDENVHLEACAMEHALSDEAERALCHMLKYPDVCPDNHLIPPCHFDFENCEECMQNTKDIAEVGIRNENLISIIDLLPKQKGTVLFIRGDEETLTKILSQGIAIGTEISFNKKDETSNVINILVNSKQKILKPEISNNIFIKIEN
jgi:DtxR family Mn-dependent transcriptional regulator